MCLEAVPGLPALDDVRDTIYAAPMGRRYKETSAQLHRKKVFAMKTLGHVLAEIRDTKSVADEKKSDSAGAGGL